MRNFFLLTLLIIPIFSFSQGNTNNKKINWISLEKAEEYASKYNQNILIFFYKPECDFCEKMKKATLSDPEVINLINTNFYPVKINGYTKNIIEFNGVIYKNEQPAEKGHSWRHDFYYEVGKYNKGIITPSIVIMNSKHEKVTMFPGFKPKIQLLREMKPYIK